MLSARATWKLLRSGDFRARIRATRDGQAAIRLHLGAAALETGVLDALAEGNATAAELAGRLAIEDRDLFAAFLRVVAAAGLVAERSSAWRLTSRGRALVGDDLVRASYEAFAGFHTGLYRDMRAQLTGGPARRDVLERGALIARISAAFEPFVLDVLTRTVTEHRPRRVLDIGCGAGLQLATMLEAAPDARGLGIDTDDGATALAKRTLGERGLGGRAEILQADVRELASESSTQPVDLVLLANVIYYAPVDERVALLQDVGRLMVAGGTLLVVTTAATPSLVSRHFDLLLRAQEGRMQLPEAGTLADQLTAAGFRPEPAAAIAPGAPLIAVRATRAP